MYEMCMYYLGWIMHFVYHALNVSGRSIKSIAIMKITNNNDCYS